MANSIASLMGLPPSKKAQDSQKASRNEERREAYLRAGASKARGHGEELALSIREDGGLALLQKALEDGLRDAFSARSPEGSALEEKRPEDSFNIGLDTSPEAVSERILGFALGFFPGYKSRNQGQDETETLNRFEQEVRRGIEEGFRKAKDALASLQMLEGEASDRIDETYGLVQDKLNAAFSQEEE